MPGKRIPLLDQVVSQLLKELADGVYPAQLPGERSLAESLGVSRPVVRSALEVLERQGWISPPGPSKARAVLKRPEGGEPQGKRIGILIARPLTELAADDVVLVTGLIRHCEENDWRCFLFPIDQLKPQHLERRLLEILETTPCDIWLGTPLSNLRAYGLLYGKGQNLIAVGTRTLTWGFGAIHYDIDSATSHAFGVMLRAGRRNIVRPIISKRPPDMVESTARLLSEYGIPYREDFHLPLFDGTRGDLLRLLDSLFAATPRPDGIIIQYTPDISILLLEGWLMERGLRFPKDLSAIQIGSDNFLRMMFRLPDHYTTEAEPLLDATHKAIQHFFATGECLSGNLALETVYVKGETV